MNKRLACLDEIKKEMQDLKEFHAMTTQEALMHAKKELQDFKFKTDLKLAEVAEKTKVSYNEVERSTH